MGENYKVGERGVKRRRQWKEVGLDVAAPESIGEAPPVGTGPKSCSWDTDRIRTQDEIGLG